MNSKPAGISLTTRQYPQMNTENEEANQTQNIQWGPELWDYIGNLLLFIYLNLLNSKKWVLELRRIGLKIFVYID